MVLDADGRAIRQGDYVTYLFTKPDGEEPGRSYWVDCVDPKRGLAHVGRLGWMGGRTLRLLPGRDVPPASEARSVRHAHDVLARYRDDRAAEAILASARNGHGDVRIGSPEPRVLAEVLRMKGYDARVEGDEVVACW